MNGFRTKLAYDSEVGSLKWDPELLGCAETKNCDFNRVLDSKGLGDSSAFRAGDGFIYNNGDGQVIFRNLMGTNVISKRGKEEFSYDSLKNGKVLMLEHDENGGVIPYFTDTTGAVDKHQKISLKLDWSGSIGKTRFSPSETKLVYQKGDGKKGSENTGRFCYCDFSKRHWELHNEVCFTLKSDRTRKDGATWSEDEKYIFFSAAGHLYIFNLETGHLTRIASSEKYHLRNPEVVAKSEIGGGDSGDRLGSGHDTGQGSEPEKPKTSEAETTDKPTTTSKSTTTTKKMTTTTTTTEATTTTQQSTEETTQQSTEETTQQSTEETTQQSTEETTQQSTEETTQQSTEETTTTTEVTTTTTTTTMASTTTTMANTTMTNSTAIVTTNDGVGKATRTDEHSSSSALYCWAFVAACFFLY